MLMFLSGLVLLIAGYFTYGRLVEKIIGPDDRKTPAVEVNDGVDYLVLPKWKNMLIQLLNIAGVGPVIGVILGVKFGEIVFLIIPIGCVIAGATHDFLAGMMSLRDNGANLTKIIRTNLGKGYAGFFSVFTVGLLLLVVAVFINIPANLCSNLICGDSSIFWLCVALIFAYYVIATLFPVDKIIGTIYPFFAAMLLLGSAALFVVMMVDGALNPDLLEESAMFELAKFKPPHAPIIPLLFVTIACGIISGFHATQSPIVARTMKSEREARITFYGMMIAEGVIAMIWAGAALIIYNQFPEFMARNPNSTLSKITTEMLGPGMGTVTVVAVIILAVTSGDTALRSTRLMASEIFRIPQIRITNRILVCLPLILVVGALLFWSNSDEKSFSYLWNYFAWGNQVLAASTLMAGTVWLMRRGKNMLIALVPGMFMTFIIAAYILWTSKEHKQAYGFGLPLWLACTIGILVACGAAFCAYRLGKKKNDELIPE